MTLPAGARLGPYEILSPIGKGGMGEVYRARDPRLGRDVAIKVLHEAASASSDRLSRFEKEARAAGALNHPHIMAIYDVGSHEGTPYVVMELLEGETLREVTVRRTPSTQQVLGWGLQVAQGLAAAHRKSIVHRDLKPENLFLTTDGQIKILDFGLAKLGSGVEAESEASTETNVTQPGVLLGTLAYMSPEQLRAGEVDNRSDIFSLGVVLYELTAGKHPFRRETVPAMLTAILQDAPEKYPISPPAERIIGHCLEKEPGERFQSAAELAKALETALQGPGEGAALWEVEEKSPYPGLSSFTEENSGNFFGREQEARTLWDKVRRHRLLAVIGPSGAGKTSFVRAGVAASRPRGWATLVSTPGPGPLRALGQTLGPELAGDPEALRKLAGFDDPDIAFDLLVRWRKRHEEALIVLDQFEELFTLNPSETQSRFTALLGRLVGEADVHVLLSLRDDFLMRCHDHPALAAIFTDLTPLGALTRVDLRRAVVEPARRLGYQFEDEALVEEVLSAVEGGRGALPLLAFAVSRLWERRDRERKLLTREAYRKIGGVEGALAQHAEATLERIGPENEAIVRSIFRNLTTAEGTRSVLSREELLSALPNREVAEAVLATLVDARLLTSYETDGRVGESGGHHVEILHESLLTAWPRLVRWQTQSADGAQLRDQLRQASHLWQERGRSDDLLWTGASYLEYQAWRRRYEGGLSSIEEEFAKAMAARASRKKRQRQIATVALVAASVVARGIYVNARDRESAHRAFVEQAQRLHAGVAGRLAQQLENLAILSNTLEVSSHVTRRQFRLLTLPILRQKFGPLPGTAGFRPRLIIDFGYIYAFEWLPLVRESERASYEAAARAEGLLDYRFWETDLAGKPRPAPQRSYYVPVYYMEPPSALALGFDISTAQGAWSTAEKARDQGRSIASPPLTLLEEQGTHDSFDRQTVVAIYSPVYSNEDHATEAARRASLSGFLITIVRVAPLVYSAAWAENASGLGYSLLDGATPMVTERGGMFGLKALAQAKRTDFDLTFPVPFADREWTLEVFALPGAFPPPKFGVLEALSAGVLAVALGLAIVALLRNNFRRRRAPAG